MATLKRELILAALATHLGLPRNSALADIAPGEPHAALHDGDADLTEEFINPPTYEWTMTPTILVAINWAEDTSPDSQLAALIEQYATAIDTTNGLGGLVSDIRAGSPDFAPKSLWGAANIKAAEMPIEIDYWSESSLG